MSRRLLMLGLDGLDRTLMNQWMAEGRLPVLRRLRDESCALLYHESNRPLPGSVWTDIATGVSAGIHGFVHELQLTPGTYRFEGVDSSRIATAPFYKTLSDAGIRCAVVDFPVDYPLDAFNGIQIVDWATEFKLWHFETRPPGLASQLVATYGKHPLTDYGRTHTGLPDLLALKHKLKHGIEVKRRFAVDLLNRREHDFIFYNFAELHKAGHFFWKFHDRSHPAFTASEPQLVDALREIYEEMDRAVGSVLEQLGSNDDLIVVTDRGMHSDHRGDHLIEKMLLKLAFAVPRGTVQAAQAPAKHWRTPLYSSRLLRKLLRFVGQRLLPEPVRQALLPVHRAALGEPPPLDWRKTRVFPLPSVGNSYLRVNLSGRDPLGLVAPGAEYQALLTEIATQFRALVNPETGERAVEDIYFPCQQFPGPKAAELPDVAIVWNSNAPINAISSKDIGTISGRHTEERTGNHRPEGFALFHGMSFASKPGTLQGDARQIAPAVLRYFGVAVPGHYEMQSPDGLFGDSSAKQVA